MTARSVRPRRGLYLVAGLVLGIGLAVWSAFPAAAATKPPGVLTEADLPGTFQGSPLTVNSAFNALVVDATACTETPQPIPGPVVVQSLLFGRTGASTPVIVAETVVSFPNPKAARTEFTRESKSAKAGVACRAVGFIPPGTATPISTVNIGALKLARTGDASFATSANATGTTTVTNFATFLRGSNVVTVAASAAPEGLTSAELQKVAARAQKRLSG